MSQFSKVIYNSNQAEIARVNRQNGTLYLNPDIWKGLPAKEREFVLLHEEGHLELKTANEFEANKYAVEKFAPVETLTNKELGQRIVIMRSILTPKTSPFIGDLVGNITNVLPVLGIGSKSRIKEAQANAQAQATVISAQAKADQKASNTKILMATLAGVVISVIVTLFFILKK